MFMFVFLIAPPYKIFGFFMLLMHLNSQLLLNGDWIKGASFYCAVVCDYHGVYAVYLANLSFTDSCKLEKPLL